MNRKISKRKATISIVFLATALILGVLSQAIMFASAQDDVATIIVDPSIGGTTDPLPGTYTYGNDTNFALAATPDSGYVFSYWVISGNFTPGHGSPTVTYILDENGTIVASFPRAGSTDLDSLVSNANPLNVSHGFGYTFEYQAIFTPLSVNPSPSPNQPHLF